MKIVNLIQRYHPAIGGSEAWCQGMCQHLAGRGMQVRVLTMNVFHEDEYWRDPPMDNCCVRLGEREYDGKVFIRRFRRNKIRPLVFRFFESVLDKRLRLYYYGPHSLEMYLKMVPEILSTDIVHLHTMPYPHNFMAFFVAKAFGKKIVMTPHFHPGHHFYERPFHYWLMRRCDAIFTVSEYERDYFIARGFAPQRIFVTYNAVIPEAFQVKDPAQAAREVRLRYAIPAEGKIVLFIGRKIDYKGVDTLIEAMRRIPREKNVWLFLVGPSFPWFDALYAALSGEDRARVIDIGSITHAEKVKFLHACDVLALPSKHEAFGIVFLEAWICGKPVIGADTGAVAKLIADAGLVVRYGDADDLREKIERLLFTPGLARALAEHGRERVLNKYTWDLVGADIERVLRRLARGGHNGQPV